MTNFVGIESEDKNIKVKNLNFIGVLIGFIWILFHFTVIYFFGIKLESVFLVGIFLGLGNFISLLVDIPIGVLQKYISSKKFLFSASIMIFVVILIFFKFIYDSNSSQEVNYSTGIVDTTINLAKTFLSDGTNIILLLLSAILYGVIKESYDVTILSYILDIGTPSEYASLISRYNLYYGGGSLVGLIFSGVLLALNIKIAIIIFIVIVSIFIVFLAKFFDNNKETVNFNKIKTFKMDTLKEDILRKKENIILKVTPENIIEASKSAKTILLKPMQIKKSINFDEIYQTTIEGFKSFYKVIGAIPVNFLLIWFMIVVLQYGFWDTFVSTFQVEFLNETLNKNGDKALVEYSKGLITGYVLLGLIVIPAFALQDFFINLSKKVSEFKIIMFGIVLSSISMFMFGIFTNIYLAILAGLINSIGYAASMPLSQSVFGGLYNESYAKKMNLNQIDSTVSAAPLKIVSNFANIIGLILGSIFVGTLGYKGFFIFFSIVLISFFIYSLINIAKFGDLKRSQLEDSTKQTKEQLNKIKNDIKEKVSEDKDFI